MIGGAVAAAAALLLGPVPAAVAAATGVPSAAGCPARPAPEVTVFTGTVTHVTDGATLARVRRSDGSIVLVSGIGPSGEPRRTWDVGARYEFHPDSAGPPYSDDGCTATRVLVPAARSYPVLEIVVGIVMLGLLIGAPALARELRRRARRPPPGPAP